MNTEAAATESPTSPLRRAMAKAARERAKKVAAARKLATHLVRAPKSHQNLPKIWAEVSGPVGDEDVVFKGGKRGEHAIKATMSDKARIMGHWEGYVVSNGYPFYKVGDKVGFYGPYSPALKAASHRSGTIVKVTPSRARVRYIPLTSRTRQEHEIWVPINDMWLRFHP